MACHYPGCHADLEARWCPTHYLPAQRALGELLAALVPICNPPWVGGDKKDEAEKLLLDSGFFRFVEAAMLMHAVGALQNVAAALHDGGGFLHREVSLRDALRIVWAARGEEGSRADLIRRTMWGPGVPEETRR